jgi:LacI family transcriptional regulator
MGEPNRSTVTIRDVAAHAGVSRMTVSRVINASTSVTPETRRRIEASIAATGYRPDPVARQLALYGKRQGVSHAERRIGIVYPADAAAPLGELLAASMDCADRAGARLIPIPLGARRDHDRLAMALDRAAVDGLLLLPGADAMADEIGEGVPAVAIDPMEVRGGVTAIRTDDLGTAHQMTEELWGLGHRRIGLLAAAFGRESEKAREWGTLRALGRCGAAALVERSAARGLQAARVAALTLLDAPGRATAIVAVNEELAIACLGAASELGIAVPRDLTICSFGDATGHATGEIVRAMVPAAEMCRTAFRLLKEQIDCRDTGQSWPAVTQILMLRTLDPDRLGEPRAHNPMHAIAAAEHSGLLARGNPYSVIALPG